MSNFSFVHDTARDRVPIPSTRTRVWPFGLVVLACLGLAYVFTSFGAEVAERQTAAFDQSVRSWILARRSPAALAFFSAVTWLGDRRVLIPAGLLAGWLLVRRGALLRPLLVAAAPIAIAPLVTLIKHSYRAGRPPGGTAEALGFSFPSGHAADSAALLLLLSYAVARERLAPRWTLLLAGFGVVAVGASRIYLDVHWASDVLGGWLIGVSFGAACVALYELARRRREIA